MTSRRPVATFAPRRDLALATGVVGLVAAGCIVVTDGPGRVLLGLAALMLIVLSATDLLWAPRLAVSSDGLVVNAPGSRARLDWQDLESLGVEERPRFGRLVRTLEIDAGDTLVVFGSHSLGTDPRTAYDLITAFDPR